jgi:DNA-binding NarL/FixJ family response regulator
VRVVLAEDQALLRDGLVRLLTAHGFEVTAAVETGPDLLKALIEQHPDVAAGGTAMDPEVVAQMLARRSRDERLSTLTPREREVLAAMAEGHANAGIAARLVITEKAVSNHINTIFAKLGLLPDLDGNRRVLAVLAFLDAAEAAD